MHALPTGPCYFYLSTLTGFQALPSPPWASPLTRYEKHHATNSIWISLTASSTTGRSARSSSRVAFTDFQDPISPDELAGLAMEEVVESRLVTRFNNKWEAAHGPSESYDHLGKRTGQCWCRPATTGYSEVHELAQPFQFIPGWRFDDVMVSFSTSRRRRPLHRQTTTSFYHPGQGKRHWRVGDATPRSEFAAHAALLHREPFEAIIDVIMRSRATSSTSLPGFLYEGYAIEPS